MLSYIVTRGEFSSRELSDPTLSFHPAASFLASFCLAGAPWAATAACQYCLQQQEPPLESLPLLLPLKPCYFVATAGGRLFSLGRAAILSGPSAGAREAPGARALPVLRGPRPRASAGLG